MSAKLLFRSVVALMAVALLVATASAAPITITHGSTSIVMDFVPVGDAGNAGDGQSQGTFGAVDYSYNIGKYEVRNAQWDAVVAADTNDLLVHGGLFGNVDKPVAKVSWNEMAMFTNWLTSGDVEFGAYEINNSGVVIGIDRDSAVSTYGTVYVIPTENEWYKAAYYDPNKDGGAGYWDYPTGSDAVPDGIDSAGDTEFDAVFKDPYTLGQPNVVTNAGVLSPYGTMGQGGNVWEWSEALFTGGGGSVRGGRWTGGSSPLAASSRSNWGTLAEESGGGSTGFRVVSIPEPGSITLLVCGLLTCLVCCRRRAGEGRR